jgi:arylsulfatase
MVFTQMYKCARCCPTRASILRGLYPHQAGVGQMVNDRGRPAYQGYLNQSCVTIAEALKAGGYRTYMSGKWHVGGPYNVQDPSSWRPGDATHPIPIQRGFDEHYGTLCGAGSYYHPPTLIHNDTFITPDSLAYHVTDAISERAAGMIERAAKGRDPFFLYVAYTAPHWPLHAAPDDIAKYRGGYARGWDAARTARHETLKGAGIVDRKWPISPRDAEVPAWSDVPDRDYQDALMATYAAMIEQMDRGIGIILAALRDQGIEQDTLVVFLSDNGGCHEFIQYRSNWARRLKRETLDGRDVVVGNAPGVLPGPDDTYQSYNRPWANVSNTPFRMFKHWVHEGGIATPLIACWPGHVRRGAISHQLCHVIDILPTCLDIAGAGYPQEHNGRKTAPVEGASLAPILSEPSAAFDRTLFWEHEGNRAVRQGGWKLVSRWQRKAWELYDMVEDRTELSDLADRNPDKVRQLEALYATWAHRVGVVPWEQLIAGR